MPAKRIKVIDIENNTTQDEEPTRDDIIDIIKEGQPIMLQPAASSLAGLHPAASSLAGLQPEEPVAMKKKKRAPKPKVPVFEKVEPPIEIPKEIEPPTEIEPPEAIEQVVVVEPDDEPKNIKTIEVVSCPKCNKKLTSRTLKYSHESVCPGNGNAPPSSINKPKKQKIVK